MAELGAESAVIESSANGIVGAPTEVQDEAVMESQPFDGNGTETERALEEVNEPEVETNAETLKEVAMKEREENGDGEDKSPGDGSEDKVKEDEKNKEVKTPTKRGRGRVSTGAKKVQAVEDKEENKRGEEETPKESKKRKIKELSTPTLDRPSRERKTIERFVASNEKEVVKEFTIEKGRGTPLKDIPNVVYKLSKRSRADDVVRLLHVVLYGKRGKALQQKKNILQFSGFVWGENEEKLKFKVKEKLDKYHKENLLNLCDLLDMHVAKTSNKKEEVVAKLLEFLESPHVTTDVLLEEKVQTLKAKKRKRKNKGTPGKTRGRTPAKSPRKKQKKSVVSKGKNEEEGEGEEDVEEENDDENDSSGDEDDPIDSEKVAEEVEEEEEEEEEEDDEDYVHKKKLKRSSKKRSKRKKSVESAGKNKVELKGIGTSPRKAVRSPKGSTAKDVSGDNADSSPHSSPTSKVFSRKNKKEKSEVDKTPVADDKKQSRKRPNASVAKSNTKEKEGKSKAKGKSSKSDPSDDDIRSAISDILQGVDFNTATFTDILKQLAGKFDFDFSERKAYLKNMIQEELSKLAEGDDEEDHSMAAEENIEKDESEDLAGQVVEAQ